MAQTTTKKKYTIVIIALLLQFVVGNFIPTWNTVTRMGVQGICIFIGLVVMGAGGIHYLFASIVTLFAIQLTGAYTFSQLLANTFGGSTIYQLIIVYGLCRALIDSGAGDVMAKWLITRKFAQGKPLTFTVVLMFAGFFAGGFIGLGGLLFYYQILDAIRNQLGYEVHSSWMKVNTMGIYLEALIGMCLFPFKGIPLIAFGPLTAALAEQGVETNDVLHMVLILIFAIIMAFVTYFVGKILKADFSKLKELDITKIEGLGGEIKMDKTQTFISIVFLISLLYTILGLFIKGTGKFATVFTGITQAGWFALCLAIVVIVDIDGKPAANASAVMSRGVDWYTIYAMVGFTQAGAVLTLDAAGIKTWLMDLFGGIFVDSGYPVFLFLLMLISWVLTNFMSNTAIGIIMGTLSAQFYVVHMVNDGLNPTVFAVGFIMSVMMAFATQASCGAAPILFGQKTINEDLKWFYSKGLFIGTVFFICAYVFTLVFSYVL